MNESIQNQNSILNTFKEFLENENIKDIFKERIIDNLSDIIKDTVKNEYITTKKYCVICWKKRINVIFKECGHFCICTDCDDVMSQVTTSKRCPICRSRGDTQEVFESYSTHENDHIITDDL